MLTYSCMFLLGIPMPVSAGYFETAQCAHLFVYRIDQDSQMANKLYLAQNVSAFFICNPSFEIGIHLTSKNDELF